MKPNPPGTPREHNLFDILRLTAAALVFYSHSYALLGLPEPWILGTMSFGGLGVAIFFGISGYLVTNSFRYGRCNPWSFLAKRSLRIFPALIVVSCLSAYVLGPSITTLDLRTYLSSPNTSAYAYWNIGLYPHFALPGVFATNPFPHAVNGSLWTLPLEFALYLAIASLAIIRRHSLHQWIVLALAILAGIGHYVMPAGRFNYYGSDLYQVVHHAPYFLVGAFLSYRDGWMRNAGQRLAIPCCFVLLFLSGTSLIQIAVWIGIPCIAVAVGEMRSEVVARLNPLGDISYGVYLWSFPIQQLVILYLARSIGAFPALLLGALFVVGIAKLSWDWVERPALTLKRLLST